jgi:hypothetical protein
MVRLCSAPISSLAFGVLNHAFTSRWLSQRYIGVRGNLARGHRPASLLQAILVPGYIDTITPRRPVFSPLALRIGGAFPHPSLALGRSRRPSPRPLSSLLADAISAGVEAQGYRMALSGGLNRVKAVAQALLLCMTSTRLLIPKRAHPLTGAGTDYDPLLEHISEARFVPLGEACAWHA